MIPRAYASDEDAEKPRWLLFARAEGDGMVFTAVVTQGARNVVAERTVDEQALQEHSEELGLEMDVAEFKTLVVKALEQRSCVDLEVATAQDETEVFLSLTYKFSPKISRKGIFQLAIVATDAPQSLVNLLTSIHAAPPQSMLSEMQQRTKTGKKSLATGAGDKKANVANSQEDRGTATASQRLENGTTTVTVNPMLLKRRRVPTGAMRRKGTKGAKLAKK